MVTGTVVAVGAVVVVVVVMGRWVMLSQTQFAVTLESSICYCCVVAVVVVAAAAVVGLVEAPRRRGDEST